eukprot:CAMPEP_0113663178 /NCGR_PEP_ID=MMETSP0038_2-20120614/992_1 /TAXON_ID=2898 /ORGANISM="Cryptomonas paramecium" /LENGTH=74 /DNA_ID=CAMNT_0000578165 /DNA_START=611 /DNA_END=832 /DNA_ORIENTATION=+ /assembly_acc=CAM_ASM_000170
MDASILRSLKNVTETDAHNTKSFVQTLSDLPEEFFPASLKHRAWGVTLEFPNTVIALSCSRPSNTWGVADGFLM